ncbi:hypothetical protein G7043_31255 [Lentzea sp. NEAU-D13]|uniref:Uncharacterized protein n=1 Tax=Lentzea alba TaxID=2714351 RepID=A0A7C9RUS0_9PSEU|nr:hypothetical protein [Lentzea alba]NGY63410.1 hypothetical protein [Lentzea alba]
MDKGDIATWVAALVAIGMAWIALHTANSAKRQANAAEQALAQARRSASAAEEQAKAAAEQVAIMRQELERQDVPRFSVEEIEEFRGGPVLPIRVTMISGADLSEVTISAEGSAIRGLAGGPDGPPAPAVLRENFTEGSQTTVYLHLHEKTATASATFTFHCTAPENGTTWDALPPKTLELIHKAIRTQGQMWGRRG